MKNEQAFFSVRQEYYPAKDEFHTYAIKINVYKPKEKVLCFAYMYDAVVIDEDDNDFDVPDTRLKVVLTCYNTQLSGLIRHKRKQYS